LSLKKSRKDKREREKKDKFNTRQRSGSTSSRKLGFLSRREKTNKRQEKPTQPPVDMEVVDLCFNFLKDFMEIEGLFRISGETAAVKEIFDSFAHPHGSMLRPNCTEPKEHV